jgi:hypothetical protein
MMNKYKGSAIAAQQINHAGAPIPFLNVTK